MKRHWRMPTVYLSSAICLLVTIGHATAAVEVVDFDDLDLAPESYFGGPIAGGATIDGRHGPETVGTFASRGVEFTNAYNTDFGSWTGFAYSNTSDVTTPGYLNQFSAVTGDGAGPGADNYGVAYGYWDLEENLYREEPFDPANADHLFALPTLRLPAARTISSAQVTNTTYAALSMQTGDQFAKPFGGESGSDPDWFKVTAYGTDEQGMPLATAVEFYLADYRSGDPADDYIIDAWTNWDLAALSGASQLHFNLSSTDAGIFGLNTPAYFAIDDIRLEVEALPGDYNADGVVNAADYTVWRDTLDNEVDRRGAGADGDLSGSIDEPDYLVWRDQYGATSIAMSGVSVVPEPTTATVVVLLLAFSCGGVRHASHRLTSRSCY
ncbi:MAG: DUF4465 domain-containing protein [Planctomycetota bacterium]